MKPSLQNTRFTVSMLLFLAGWGYSNTGNPCATSVAEIPSLIEATYTPFGIVIVDFTIVDAVTDEDLFAMKKDAIIDPSLLSNYNIRANDYEGQTEGIWVTFTLSGPVNRTWTERQAPFALFGDSEGDYNQANLPEGSYHLVAAGTSSGDELINEIEINFTVGPDVNAVTDLNFIEARYGTDPSGYTNAYNIKNGQEFDRLNYPHTLGGTPNPVSIRAHTSSYNTGSVVFSLTGPVSLTRTENQEPFTLFGDSNGIYNGQILTNGQYTLRVTPYSLSGGRGLQGLARTVQFTIANFPGIVLNETLDLISAGDDQIINYLSTYDNSVIDLSGFPDGGFNLSTSASYGTGTIGSVFMTLEGPVSHTQTETFEPYALFGDTSGDFNGRYLPAGSYILKITPYTGPNRSGLAGRSFLFNFDITDTAPLSGTLILSGPVTERSQLRMYPNPAVTEMWLTGQNDPILKAAIHDFSGIKIMDIPRNHLTENAIDVSALKKGMYFIRIETAGEKQTRRLVVH